MNFLCGVVVVGIVEGCAVGQDGPRAGNRVVEDAFHTVAVARIAGDAQQVARDLEMSVNAAGSFETGVRQAETLPESIASGLDERFVRAPSAGDVALFLDHAEAVGRGAQILFVAEHQISLHRGAERVHVTVGVLTGKVVRAFRERIKVFLLDEADGEILVTGITAALIGEEEIFRQRVGFIEGVGNILVETRALFGAAERFFRQVRQHGLRAAPEHIERGGIAGEFVGINQAAAGFVEGISGQAIIHIKLPGGIHRCAVAANQTLHFFLRGFRAGDGVRAREPRKILAETVPGDESMEIIHRAEIISVVVPAAHVWADRGETFALAERFEQRIFIEMQV